jgi:arsenite/tail-anchored protein-transporting ATPase
MKPQVIYSVGKGGVGKTTCAAALALHVSDTRRTLVVSLDPAHNLGDVLASELSDAPREVARNLWAFEVNMDAAIGRYLAASRDQLRQMYGYLSTINLDGYLDALRLSPGIEEYATLQAMESLLREAEGKYEMVVFDTPPTGLTLRVLALPKVSLLWGDRLSRLRRDILDKRHTIERISGKKKFVLEGQEYELPVEEKSDPVMRELNGYVERMERMMALQSDPARCRVMPVMNPDRLSLFETTRAFETLSELKMPIGPVIVNKVGLRATDSRTLAEIEQALGKPVRTLPYLETEPVGLTCLRQVGELMNFEEWVPRE